MNTKIQSEHIIVNTDLTHSHILTVVECLPIWVTLAAVRGVEHNWMKEKIYLLKNR
jgi:hypothetical protein